MNKWSSYTCGSVCVGEGRANGDNISESDRRHRTIIFWFHFMLVLVEHRCELDNTMLHGSCFSLALYRIAIVIMMAVSSARRSTSNSLLLSYNNSTARPLSSRRHVVSRNLCFYRHRHNTELAWRECSLLCEKCYANTNTSAPNPRNWQVNPSNAIENAKSNLLTGIDHDEQMRIPLRKSLIPQK